MLHRFPVIFIILLSLFPDVQPGVFPDSVFGQMNKPKAMEVVEEIHVVAQVLAPSMATLAGSAEGSVELIIPKVRKGFCVSSDLTSVVTCGKTPTGLIPLHSEVTQHPEVQSTVQEMLLLSALWVGKFFAKLWFLSPDGIWVGGEGQEQGVPFL